MRGRDCDVSHRGRETGVTVAVTTGEPMVLVPGVLVAIPIDALGGTLLGSIGALDGTVGVLAVDVLPDPLLAGDALLPSAPLTEIVPMVDVPPSVVLATVASGLTRRRRRRRRGVPSVGCVADAVVAVSVVAHASASESVNSNTT